MLPHNATLSKMPIGACAPQNGDCHQFPPLELAGCTRFAHAQLTSPYPAPIFIPPDEVLPHNATLSKMPIGACAPQNGDCHQFPPLELAGCTRFAHAQLTSPCPAPIFIPPDEMLPHNATLSKMPIGACAPQNGDCHQFPPLELAGCSGFAHGIDPRHRRQSNTPVPRRTRGPWRQTPEKHNQSPPP